MSSEINIVVREIKTTDLCYGQVYNLRESVLRVPLGLSLANEDLSKDKDDIVLAAFCSGNVVGCVMLQHLDIDRVKLRQMAVNPGLQTQGVGTAIVSAAEKTCRERGYKKIVLHAREIARGFYEKAGYLVCSDQFEEVGIPHYAMEKDI